MANEDIFQIGENVICSAVTKNAAGSKQNPATSMKIVIKIIRPTSSTVVESTDMDNDDTGEYSYSFDTVGEAAGEYQITYTAIDGSKTSIGRDTFHLEA